MQCLTRDIRCAILASSSFFVKGSAGVLVSTITVEQRVRIWSFLNDLVKDQFIVISVTNTATSCIAL